MALMYPYNQYIFFVVFIGIGFVILIMPFGGKSFHLISFCLCLTALCLFFRVAVSFAFGPSAAELSATGALTGGLLILIIHTLWPSLYQKQKWKKVR